MNEDKIYESVLTASFCGKLSKKVVVVICDLRMTNLKFEFGIEKGGVNCIQKKLLITMCRKIYVSVIFSEQLNSEIVFDFSY